MNTLSVIFLKPYLDPKIWGGVRLQEYGYNLPQHAKIGEALIISALKDKPSLITGGKFDGVSLADFFENQNEFFGNYNGPYPLLTKIIDANEKLSVQVHPDNNYAQKFNQLGKTECWYILDAPSNASIVYGLKTQTKEATAKIINDDLLEDYLNYLPVKKGDIIFVPSGTVHAITAGLLIYELQQSSDITYRLFDYHRLENNKPRALHIEDALNVIRFDFPKLPQTNEYLIDCDFFKLKKVQCTNKTIIDIPSAYWVEVTVIEGALLISGRDVNKGSTFIIGHKQKIDALGTATILIAYVEKIKL